MVKTDEKLQQQYVEALRKRQATKLNAGASQRTHDYETMSDEAVERAAMARQAKERAASGGPRPQQPTTTMQQQMPARPTAGPAAHTSAMATSLAGHGNAQMRNLHLPARPNHNHAAPLQRPLPQSQPHAPVQLKEIEGTYDALPEEAFNQRMAEADGHYGAAPPERAFLDAEEAGDHFYGPGPSEAQIEARLAAKPNNNDIYGNRSPAYHRCRSIFDIDVIGLLRSRACCSGN
jgi:hypothetical protein